MGWPCHPFCPSGTGPRVGGRSREQCMRLSSLFRPGSLASQNHGKPMPSSTEPLIWAFLSKTTVPCLYSAWIPKSLAEASWSRNLRIWSRVPYSQPYSCNLSQRFPAESWIEGFLLIAWHAHRAAPPCPSLQNCLRASEWAGARLGQNLLVGCVARSCIAGGSPGGPRPAVSGFNHKAMVAFLHL